MPSHNASYKGQAQERKVDKGPDGFLDAGHQSRLLTKKQISDMAFGIRELAKRLAHIRLKINVQHVFLLAKAHDVTLIANTREVAKWLLTRDQPYKV